MLGLALVLMLASAGVALAHKVVSFLEEDIWNLSGLKSLSSEIHSWTDAPPRLARCTSVAGLENTVAAAV